MTKRRVHAFDLDGTLVPGSLTERAFWHLAEMGELRLSDDRVATLAAWRQRFEETVRPDHDYAVDIVAAIVEGTRGIPVQTLRRMAAERAEADYELIYPEMKGALARARRPNQALVLISGSMDIFVRAFGRRLGAAAVTGSRFYTQGGAIHHSKPARGLPAKDDVLLGMCESLGGTPYAAYGDTSQDLPMLIASAHPHAVNPDMALRAAAESLGWPIIDCHELLPNA
ncbi:MAG TPA: haloacid dehalogenase-like hydrolase [Candidatus Saccharimonadales bacterium]|nr:haloacid dehalogenase-like hydrolase [Candidatus Saccharimonadales bacterium]